MRANAAWSPDTKGRDGPLLADFVEKVLVNGGGS
jgi:hypothetical protein